MGKDLNLGREEAAIWETGRGIPIQSLETGARVQEIARLVWLEQWARIVSREWDQRRKEGGRGNPVRPCKLLWGFWLLLDWNGELLEGFEQHDDMMWFSFKKDLRGFCVGNREVRVEAGIS